VPRLSNGEAVTAVHEWQRWSRSLGPENGTETSAGAGRALLARDRQVFDGAYVRHSSCSARSAVEF
jgi:hypothetical protein